MKALTVRRNKKFENGYKINILGSDTYFLDKSVHTSKATGKTTIQYVYYDKSRKKYYEDTMTIHRNTLLLILEKLDTETYEELAKIVKDIPKTKKLLDKNCKQIKTNLEIYEEENNSMQVSYKEFKEYANEGVTIKAQKLYGEGTNQYCTKIEIYYYEDLVYSNDKVFMTYGLACDFARWIKDIFYYSKNLEKISFKDIMDDITSGRIESVLEVEKLKISLNKKVIDKQ